MRPPVRHLGPAILLTLVASLFATTTTTSAQEPPEDPPISQEVPESLASVRIQARLLGSGSVEFGLELDGEREWLPRLRFFPYDSALEDRWLYSSPYELSHGRTIRIQARLVASGKVEFGLEFPDRSVWLPRSRLFPYATASEGRWLYSSLFETPTVGAPRLLRVDSVICDRSEGIHSVRLAWDPADAGGSAILGYAVTREHALLLEFVASIPDPYLDVTVTGTSFLGVDVHQSVLYEWSVRTLTPTGISDAASAQFIYRPRYGSSDPWDPAVRHDYCDEYAAPSRSATSPGAPQDVRAEWDGAAGLVYVSWSPPADDGGDQVTSYRVSYTDVRNGRATWTIAPALPEGRHAAGFTIERLPEGRVRYFSVAAVNSRGTGRPATVDFSFEGAPGRPRNLRLLVFCDEAGQPERAEFLWDPPEGSDISGYLVQAHWRSTDAGAHPQSHRWHPTTETSLTIDDYFDYVFGGQHDVTLMVRAHNDDGPSGFAQRTENLRRHECAR
ncbi:MAG: fibronectin type III domain-containing protein [bacterium]|nr:fibronectin type III domain-containing protein [bacterium]